MCRVSRISLHYIRATLAVIGGSQMKAPALPRDIYLFSTLLAIFIYYESLVSCYASHTRASKRI